MSSDKLIIYRNNDGTFQYGVLQSTDTFESKSQPLSDLSQSIFSDIILIASPAAVLLTEANLPKMSTSRLLQALPFALEDHLLTDISESHFAIPDLPKPLKEASEQAVPAAIVAKSHLTQWIHELHDQGIYPTAVIPAPLLIAREQKEWSILVSDTFSLIRTGDYAGVSCDTTNLATYVASLLTETSEQPSAIAIYNFSSTSIELNVPANIIEKPVNYGVLEFFAKHITTPTINLLQGEYRAKRKKGEGKNPWRWIPLLAAGWIGLILLSNSVSYLVLHHKASGLQAEIKSIYKENFPNATSVVAAKQRMTDKLNSLASGGQKNHFLAWLTVLAQSLHDTQFSIKQVDYQNNLVNVQFAADNFSTVDGIIKSLKNHNISAKQQNVSQDGTGVKGILVISEGNPS